MKVSIVIVSWNVKAFLSDCIDSIHGFPTKHSVEIIVVDNASSDGTVDHLRSRYPDVRLVENLENAGFARANNQGAAIATGEYLYILNPDTLFLEESLDELVDFMDRNPDIAMCGPRVLNDDGSLQRSVRRFPTWKAAFCRYSVLKYFGIFRAELEHWRCRDFNYDRQQDAEQLIGAAMLVRREVFERFGGFDERFFMYYEEVDLCYRIKTGGLRVVYYPGAALIHLGGKSSDQVPAKKQFMILQSLLGYLRKHTAAATAGRLACLFKLGVLAQQLYECLFCLTAYLLATLLGASRKKAKYRARHQAAREFIARYCRIFLQV
jgi:GT2 family glycosyltransferase